MTSCTDSTSAPCIVVLLTTYNGAAFLPQQLDSILAQTHSHMLLLCRDDASTDSQTPAILFEYARTNPNRIQVIQDSHGNLGVKQSFSHLMDLATHLPQAKHHYYALADQDDIWHQEKLSTLLSQLQALELENPSIPILVHSDLQVVDQTGQTIAPLFSVYQGLKPNHSSLVAQMVSNTLTGCTALFNHALLTKCLPVPSQSMMHDHWISLVASAFGRRAFVPQPLVDYRQHNSNTLGAHAHRPGPGFHKLTSTTEITQNWLVVKYWIRRFFDSNQQQIFNGLASQADMFGHRFSKHLSLKNRFFVNCVRLFKWLPAPLQRLLFWALRRL